MQAYLNPLAFPGTKEVALTTFLKKKGIYIYIASEPINVYEVLSFYYIMLNKRND